MKKTHISLVLLSAFVGTAAAAMLFPIVTETAQRGPSDTPNSAFVPPDYPETKVPWFISMDDSRDWADRGTTMYIKLPATNGYELRIYPTEIDHETAQQLKAGEALLGIKCYVEEFDGPNRRVTVQ